MDDSSRLELRIARVAMAQSVRDLDAGALSAADAVSLVDAFAELKNLAAAGEAIAAAAVAATNAWYGSGERSPSDWLAKRTGTSLGAARGALETAEKLADAPATDEAFRAGVLSAAQAEAIAGAAAANPAAEDRLLGMAQHQSLTKLRDECARVKASAVDMEARHREIHRRRSFRAWTDADGARCGMYKTTPEAGAEIEREIKRFADAAFERARIAGEHEPSEAYAADGMLNMARASRGDTCATKQKRREGVLLVNLESLQRGDVADGELCEIPGVGPVPISVARDLLGESLLRVVIRDGVDIRTVVHAGRLASDVQRTAIQVRDSGRCRRPTCANPIAQIDHITGYTITGATPLHDLGGLCERDHKLKTHHGHTYRHGEHGWEWHLPDGTIEHERPPP